MSSLVVHSLKWFTCNQYLTLQGNSGLLLKSVTDTDTQANAEEMGLEQKLWCTLPRQGQTSSFLNLSFCHGYLGLNKVTPCTPTIEILVSSKVQPKVPQSALLASPWPVVSSWPWLAGSHLLIPPFPAEVRVSMLPDHSGMGERHNSVRNIVLNGHSSLSSDFPFHEGIELYKIR